MSSTKKKVGFPFFERFPPIIQNRIWHYAIRARVVTITRLPESEYYKVKRPSARSDILDGLALFTTTSKVPPVLSVCRASRQVGLSRFTVILGSLYCQAPLIYIDLAIDALCIPNIDVFDAIFKTSSGTLSHDGILLKPSLRLLAFCGTLNTNEIKGMRSFFPELNKMMLEESHGPDNLLFNYTADDPPMSALGFYDSLSSPAYTDPAPLPGSEEKTEENGHERVKVIYRGARNIWKGAYLNRDGPPDSKPRVIRGTAKTWEVEFRRKLIARRQIALPNPFGKRIPEMPEEKNSVTIKTIDSKAGPCDAVVFSWDVTDLEKFLFCW